MDTSAYLQRMHYQGSQQANASTLAALQLAHMQAVPFENLSIHYGQPIVLEPALLFQKIVAQRRGGFCYELNGLFAVLLEQLGFQVTRLSARVALSKGGYSPEFDHMLLLVHLEHDYLVDVGFGDSFLQPLRLHEAAPQVQGHMAYQIAPEGEAYILLQQNNGDAEPSMLAQMRFTTMPRTLQEFGPMCQFHQTSPDSHFTQKRICSRATPEGRISLSNLKWIVTQKQTRTERLLTSEEEFLGVLQAEFGVSLPTPPL